ncbi:MAG: radical SAM protein [Magnetococcales bacterium]|nr:radical SAM protein [Magnetococcales bacterium]
MNWRDALSYGWRIVHKNGPPIHLIFFITSRCNLRCGHCFYWKALDADHSHELTLEEIERAARSLPRLLLLSLTGGEPFVRKDVGEIVEIFARHCRTHITTLSTNGAYPERMEATIPRLLERHPGKLYVYLSLDGPEEIHDALRGAGSHRAAMNALRLMQPWRKRFPHFGVSLSMTCNALNEAHLEDYFREVTALGLADNVNIGFVRGDPKNPLTREVGLESYRRLTRMRWERLGGEGMRYFRFLLGGVVASKDYYACRIVEEVIEKNHFVLPCTAGSLLGVLYDDGRVSPCEILEQADLGNLRQWNGDLARLWQGEVARTWRRKIVEEKCFCTFECAMTDNILFNPKYLAKCAGRAAAKSLSRSGS